MSPPAGRPWPKACVTWLNDCHRRSSAPEPIAWSQLYGKVWTYKASKAALRLIMQSFTGQDVPLATLAFSIGRAVEEELKAPPNEPWTDATHFRVGMVLIEVVVNATGWLQVGHGSPDHRQAWCSPRRRSSRRHYGPPLVLMMQPTVTDWLGSEIAATLCGAAPAANIPDLMPPSEAIARRHIASPAFYEHHAQNAHLHA